MDAEREGQVAVIFWSRRNGRDAAARAWRDHPELAAIRAAGRAHWYDAYAVTVARVERSYRWTALSA